MFIHGLEIATILVLGVLYLCPDILPSKEEENTEQQQQRPSLTERTWFKKLVLFLAKIQGEVSTRIHSDSCCICFDNIKNEVRGCCGHVFCGSCLFKFWNANGQEKMNCPLCRKGMNMVMFDLAKEEGNIVDHETAKIIKNVESYNNMFSKQPQTIEQVFLSLQTAAMTYMTSFIKKGSVITTAKASLGVLAGLMLIMYILSPSMLVPACNSLVSWLENILLIVFSVLYATVKYKDSKKSEEAPETL